MEKLFGARVRRILGGQGPEVENDFCENIIVSGRLKALITLPRGPQREHYFWSTICLSTNMFVNMFPILFSPKNGFINMFSTHSFQKHVYTNMFFQKSFFNKNVVK